MSDEAVHVDADEAIADQTITAQAITKLVRRRPPLYGIRRNPDRTRRVHLGATSISALYFASDAIFEISENASDGSQDVAKKLLDGFEELLGCYPVKWQDPKSKGEHGAPS